MLANFDCEINISYTMPITNVNWFWVIETNWWDEFCILGEFRTSSESVPNHLVLNQVII